jgi:hypothetical protein
MDLEHNVFRMPSDIMQGRRYYPLPKRIMTKTPKNSDNGSRSKCLVRLHQRSGCAGEATSCALWLSWYGICGSYSCSEPEEVRSRFFAWLSQDNAGLGSERMSFSSDILESIEVRSKSGLSLTEVTEDELHFNLSSSIYIYVLSRRLGRIVHRDDCSWLSRAVSPFPALEAGCKHRHLQVMFSSTPNIANAEETCTSRNTAPFWIATR